MLLGVTRDTEVAFGKFPYFPYQTETFRYGMVWEWYGKRIRFPIPYHTVVRHTNKEYKVERILDVRQEG